MNIGIQYIDSPNNVLREGVSKCNRIIIGMLMMLDVILQYDMFEEISKLTMVKTYFRDVKLTREDFSKNIFGKKWFQERNCIIWNDWYSFLKISYNNNDETEKEITDNFASILDWGYRSAILKKYISFGYKE